MVKLKEAYVGYSTGDSKNGIKLKVLHSKVNPVNMNKLDHIDYVANAFSYMISLQVYLSDKYNKHIDRVIISDEQLSQYIGCHVNSSSRIIAKLQAIFDLTVQRRKERGGAREIIINKRVIDFLKVCSLEDINNYIEQYHLDSAEEYRAIQQLYRYRVWGVKDTQLETHEVQAKHSFLKRAKNFIHRVITNNRTEQQRIHFVTEHKELLSELNQSQLDRIRQEIIDGPLSHYWLMTLIRLEQKVSLALRKANKHQKNNSESNRENTSLTNSESNAKETTAHASATRVAQRKPESDPTPGDIIEVLASWNNMARVQKNIPHVQSISEKEINAIRKQVKSYGKETILSSIKKVTGLYKVSNGSYQMTFSKFMTKKTIELILTTNITEDISGSDWFDDYMIKRNGMQVIDVINTENLPQFNTFTNAIQWWNTTQNS